MKLNKFVSAFTIGSLFLMSCSTSKPEADKPRDPASITGEDIASIFTGNKVPNFFIPKAKDIALAPTANLDLKQGEFVFDNYRAFATKLNLVHNAKHTIDMVYYIYSNDVTSALFNQEIIAAARRGVKVRLLVDSFSTYKDMDLLRFLKSQSPNIEVKLYNLPTKGFLEQAFILTSSCPQSVIDNSTCASYKRQSLNLLEASLGNNVNSFQHFMAALTPAQRADMGMYLSGVYAKNPMAMVIPIQEHAKALMAKASSTKMTPTQKENLKKLGKIYWDSKTGTAIERVQADVELFIGSLMNREMFKMLDEKAGAMLPVELAFSGSGGSPLTGDTHLNLDGPGEGWAFLTDYTHHKLILVDGDKFVLGGRNIEDSYHTSLKEPLFGDAQTNKYLFWDTDFSAELKGSSTEMVDSYSRLFNFAPMALDADSYYKNIPNDFVSNAAYVKTVCKTRNPGTTDEVKAQVKACMASDEMRAHFADTFADRAKRVDDDMRTHAQIALKKFVRSSSGTGTEKFYEQGRSPVSSSDRQVWVDAKDLADGAKVHYLENLNWARATPNQRHLGSNANTNVEDNKNIQAVWKHVLKNTCEKKSGSRQVIINNAYFYPSADMLATLSNMLDGSWNCPGVEISILTNSFQTTDLNVVNLFARHSLLALTKVANNPVRDEKLTGTPAKLKLYELKLLPGEEGLSLHTKLLLAGDDIVVGSANWDVRSHIMDTNNALWFENAPTVAFKYSEWFRKYVVEFKDPSGAARVTDVTGTWGKFENSALIAQDMQMLDQMAARWHVQSFMDKRNPGAYQGLKDRLTGMLNKAYAEAYSFLKKKGVNPVKVEAVPGSRDAPGVGVQIDLLRVFDNQETYKLDDMKKFNDYFKTI